MTYFFIYLLGCFASGLLVPCTTKILEAPPSILELALTLVASWAGVILQIGLIIVFILLYFIK
jgi:hypothetical protein